MPEHQQHQLLLHLPLKHLPQAQRPHLPQARRPHLVLFDSQSFAVLWFISQHGQTSRNLVPMCLYLQRVLLRSPVLQPRLPVGLLRRSRTPVRHHFVHRATFLCSLADVLGSSNVSVLKATRHLSPCRLATLDPNMIRLLAAQEDRLPVPHDFFGYVQRAVTCSFAVVMRASRSTRSVILPRQSVAGGQLSARALHGHLQLPLGARRQFALFAL